MRSAKRCTQFAAAIGLGLSVTMWLTACGSSGSTASEGAAAASQAPSLKAVAPAPTKAPIVIGMLAGATGPNAEAQGPSIAAAQAWQKWVNTDLGGINGHPVDLIAMDNKSDPATTIALANQMIHQDHVIALVGSDDTVTEALWTKAFASAKVPVIGGTIADDAAGASSPYVFDITPGLDTYLKLTVDAAKQGGAKKFGAVLCSESPNCANANAVWQAEATKDGLPYAGYVQVAAAAPDYTAACLSLEQRGVDWVDLGVFPQVAVRVVADCAQQGYNPHYTSTGAGVDGQLIPASQSGMSYTGITQGFPWWLTTPAVQQYQQVMDTFSNVKKVNPNPTTSATWAALELFRTAMAHVGASPTSQDVVTAMDSLKNSTVGGLLPQPTAFTAGAVSPQVKCAWVVTLENGTFSGGEKPECLS